VRVVDVVVVGAGPAGTATAIELSAAGREVLVIDRARFPRDKCCGDGLTAGALRHLDELGLRPSAVATWHPVAGCSIRSPSGRIVELPFLSEGLLGAVARRSDLDAALVDRARAAGADVLEGHAFEAMRWTPDGVTVRAEGLEPVGARYVVAADGVWSPVRKAAGLGEPGYRGEWHAFRQYVRAPGEGARRLWVWFEPELLPGYAWSFPLPGGIANVGFGVRRRPGEPAGILAERWRRLIELPHVRATLGDGAVPEAPHKTWPIPTRLATSPVVGAGGRVLFVGDAARAGDPLTGEGIGQALETGRMAADAIDRAGPKGPAVAGLRYATSLRRSMVVDHRLAGALSWILESRAGARGAVRIAGVSPWTRRNFARWLFEDYPRAALVTPRRWEDVWRAKPAFAPGHGMAGQRVGSSR
jgi:geranylgeranyl reductase family protein